MPIADDTANSIFVVLNNLIHSKAKRDKININNAQLAKAINIPRSVLLRLIHQDPKKRVTKPKIETLIKIVDFFNTDGFSITLDDLLGIRNNSINVQDQIMPSHRNASLKSNAFSHDRAKNISRNLIDIEISTNIATLQLDEDIKPMFKKGSTFIIDKKLNPDNDNLIALTIGDKSDLLIRKYQKVNGKIILKSLDTSDKDIILNTNANYSILGVVIKIYAKT